MNGAFNLIDFVLIALAAMAAGFVNAIAGGGTLISFPALIGVRVPPVAANVTNTVALVPGYLGATFAQMKDLSGQERRLRLLLPTAVLGGVTGGAVLLNTGERLFSFLVPYLILLAAFLLAIQDWVRSWVARRIEASGGSAADEAWSVGPVFLASIYGGYFGAGLSVIILAVLGLVLDDTLTRLNGLKQIVAFAVNVAAAIFFLFSGQVVWPAALVMAAGSVVGGLLGGKLARFVQPRMLRMVVVTIAVLIALVYLMRR
ncbi:MAG: sulfite exporter TauE/SafE family protein [Caldilinea sp.]|nr:sulfite exporter TauE/SafE family protein [Caldilinea sp.]MDW8441610.1 sulfite exporter TauE/SafE family protein [Caldilineaceae bacterium]